METFYLDGDLTLKFKFFDSLPLYDCYETLLSFRNKDTDKKVEISFADVKKIKIYAITPRTSKIHEIEHSSMNLDGDRKYILYLQYLGPRAITTLQNFNRDLTLKNQFKVGLSSVTNWLYRGFCRGVPLAKLMESSNKKIIRELEETLGKIRTRNLEIYQKPSKKMYKAYFDILLKKVLSDEISDIKKYSIPRDAYADWTVYFKNAYKYIRTILFQKGPFEGDYVRQFLIGEVEFTPIFPLIHIHDWDLFFKFKEAYKDKKSSMTNQFVKVRDIIKKQRSNRSVFDLSIILSIGGLLVVQNQKTNFTTLTTEDLFNSKAKISIVY